MENLSEEGKAIYDALRKEAAGSATELEGRLVATIESAIQSSVTAAIKDMRMYTDGAEQEIRQELADLRNNVDSANVSTDAPPPQRTPRAAESGPGGLRSATSTRGMERPAVALYVPPPARGTREISANPAVNLFNRNRSSSSPGSGRLPFMDFPRFTGENPKLWQSRCEDYFVMFDTDPALWISVAAIQFEGAAARWLQAVQSKIVSVSWEEFCSMVLQRFGRNQHQTLVRRLYRLFQTGSVDDYIEQFMELVDQLSAYETSPDPLHYTTRF
jgi:hypothetical protein